MAEFNIDDIQEKIGYTFKNSTLLKQAFTTPSVTVASGRKIQNYQVLEFIGDAVLELAVVKNLVSEFCKIDNDGQMVSKTNEGKLTVRKQDFVKNETLAQCANAIGLNKYINKAYGFCSYNHKDKKGDLIEAVLGAVALDSSWNLEVLSDVAKKIFEHKNVEANANSATADIIVSRLKNEKAKKILERKKLSPATKLDNLYTAREISKPIYELENIQNGSNLFWRCSVTLPEIQYKFFTVANSQKVAKRISAQKLVDYLKSIAVSETTPIKQSTLASETTPKPPAISNDEKVVRGQGLLKLIISKYMPIDESVA